MTLSEAMATHGAPWLSIWIPILLFGGLGLPLLLLIWRPTRIAAVLCVAAVLVAGFFVFWMYEQMGYVRLLGLPHIIFWTPLVIYLWRKFKSEEVTTLPRAILGAILIILSISLAFDYVDVVRHMLGEQGPIGMPATEG